MQALPVTTLNRVRTPHLQTQAFSCPRRHALPRHSHTRSHSHTQCTAPRTAQYHSLKNPQHRSRQIPQTHRSLVSNHRLLSLRTLGCCTAGSGSPANPAFLDVQIYMQAISSVGSKKEHVMSSVGSACTN